MFNSTRVIVENDSANDYCFSVSEMEDYRNNRNNLIVVRGNTVVDRDVRSFPSSKIQFWDCTNSEKISGRIFSGSNGSKIAVNISKEIEFSYEVEYTVEWPDETD